MTPEERAKKCCRACLLPGMGAAHNCVAVAREIKQAIEAEREANAEIVEAMDMDEAPSDVANRIRARSSGPAKSGEKA